MTEKSIMETRLIRIDIVPNEQELISLLGEKIYRYYSEICTNIISFLSPDLENWSYAGRRGKYYHGYWITPKSIKADLYLIQGHITCEFHFNKRFFQKILKRRELLKSETMQKAVDYSIKYNEEYGRGYYVSVVIWGEEEFQDMLEIIKTVATSKKNT